MKRPSEKNVGESEHLNMTDEAGDAAGVLFPQIQDTSSQKNALAYAASLNAQWASLASLGVLHFSD